MREVWGAFSAADHQRVRPFVADLLLYDRLLVPYPATDEELARWRTEGWDPDGLDRILQGIEKLAPELVVRVPWTPDRSAAASRVCARRVETDRSRLAGKLEPRGRTMAKSRGVIMAEVERQRIIQKDRRASYLAAAMPRFCEIFPAYADTGVDREWIFLPSDRDTSSDHVRAWRMAGVFRAELVVPADSSRSDQQLLAEAVRLALDDDFREARVAYHDLRRHYVHTELSDVEVARELRQRATEFRDITAANVRRGRIFDALTVVGVGSGVAAVAVSPLAGLGAPVCELVKVAATNLRPQRAVGQRHYPVAIVHRVHQEFKG